MAFSHGSKQKIVWNGFDLTGFSKNLDIEPMVDKAESTVFGLASKTYITGLKDAKVTLAGQLDGAQNDPRLFTDLAATALAGIIGTSFPQGDAVGNIGYGFLAFETSIKVATPIHDIATLDSTFEVTGGVDPVTSLHALAAEAGAVAQPGTGVDNAAQTTNGGVGYVQCDGGGTNGTVTAKVQHSTDNITYVDLATFTLLATQTRSSEQQVVAAGTTVRRYTGVTLSGTTNGAKVQVSFGRR